MEGGEQRGAPPHWEESSTGGVNTCMLVSSKSKVSPRHSALQVITLSQRVFLTFLNPKIKVWHLTLDAHNELAGGSVAGLVVHFVSDDVCSFLKVGVGLLAH